jgi:hypothetical protein
LRSAAVKAYNACWIAPRDVQPGRSLRFDSDRNLNGRPFATFSTLLIERITLNPISD